MGGVSPYDPGQSPAFCPMPVPAVTSFAMLAVALPFLFPWTSSPLPAFWQLLFSWTCVGVLAALAGYWPATRDSWARRLAAGLLLAALVSAVIGLLQYFGIGEYVAAWGYPGEAGQAQGHLRQRNQQASLLNLGCWGALWLSVQRPLAVSTGRPARMALLSALLLLAVGCAATASRTGAVQWLLMGGLLMLWWRGERPAVLRWGLLAALTYALAAAILPLLLRWMRGGASLGLFERIIQEPAGCESRGVLWANVLALIAQRPWLGWGWGELDYAHYMTLFEGPRFCALLDNAHNLPLQLAVELGLPLALLVCAGALALLWRARPWREQVPARQLAWGVLGLIGLHSLLEYPLWYGPFQLVALLALVLLGPAGTPRARVPRWVLGATLGIGVAWGSYLLWDYHRVRQLFLEPQARDQTYREQTLAKVGGSWFHAQEVDFAVVSITPLTLESAPRIHALARSLLHYSPEPIVIEALIGSACLLGRHEEAVFHQVRYRAAYAREHARWQQGQPHCPGLSPAMPGPAAESPAPHPSTVQTQ